MRRWSALLVAIIVSGCGNPAPATNSSTASPAATATPTCATHRVLLLSDLHGGIGQAVRTAFDRGPYDVLVSLGDAIDVDDGPALDEVARRWQLVEGSLGATFQGAARFWVVGNHEVGTRLAQNDPARVASTTHLRAIDGLRPTDPLYFTFSAAGLRWIALDFETPLPAGKAVVPGEVAWLDAQLADATPTIVLSHSPIGGTKGFPPSVPGTMYFANGSTLNMDVAGTRAVFSVAGVDAIRSIIRPPVALVLSGHNHSYNRWRDAATGIDYVNLGTANTSLALSVNKPSGDFVHAYANPADAGYALPYALARPMFSVLTVAGANLDLDTYSAQNEPLDHLTLHLSRASACG